MAVKKITVRWTVSEVTSYEHTFDVKDLAYALGVDVASVTELAAGAIRDRLAEDIDLALPEYEESANEVAGHTSERDIARVTTETEA